MVVITVYAHMIYFYTKIDHKSFFLEQLSEMKPNFVTSTLSVVLFQKSV